jgi:hypothetical protein
VTQELTPKQIADITGMLGHVAGILEHLPLEAYELAIRDRTSQLLASGDEFANPSVTYRSRRYASLRMAARYAGNLVGKMTAALAHQRAAVAADAEAGRQDRPGPGVVTLEPRWEVIEGGQEGS